MKQFKSKVCEDSATMSFNRRSKSSLPFFIVESGSVTNRLKEAKISGNDGMIAPRQTLTTLYKDSQAK